MVVEDDKWQKNLLENGLFNEFYIISVDKSKCLKLKEVGEVQNLQPQVNYFFTPQQDKNFDDQKKIVPGFVFPFGVEVKKCQKTESNSELNQFIFSSHNVDRYKHCYVFTLKTEESYAQEKTNQQDDEKNQGKNFLSQCNPQKLKYCICVTTKDYIDGGEEKKNKKHFYTVNNTFCLVTYYPFINFFIEVIGLII
jgi:hypothetical protein